MSDCCTVVLLFKAIREGCRMFCSSRCRCLRALRIPYIAVSSVHVIICTHSYRKYKQLWDIMYYTSTFDLYTYVSSNPGEALHSLFFSACPCFTIFVGLAFSRFDRLARLSVFFGDFFSNRIIRSSRTRFLRACLYDLILHKIPNIK